MIALWLSLGSAQAMPPTVRAPLPEVDVGGLVFLQASPTEWQSCALIAVLDQHGYVRTTMIEDCPDPLLDETMNTLARWDFYPPSDGGVAHAEDVVVEFRYISGIVVTDPPPGDQRPRVRVPPAAVPLWPVPPKLKGELKKQLKAEGEAGLLCQLELAFTPRGAPTEVEILDCPEPAAELAVKKLARHGVQLIEAEPGDGTRYRYEIWMTAGRPPKE